ncbi:restriction endonuclease subunit S [Salinivibrio kushneri]|uniref:restriction endonuclease subunit S n=1 Tax=Salinivibrio kushneri TaxID=1908198 RepID=UPI0009885D29|nr:restriction endonuclease subunit S [Salinivibrio kushneri]OOE50297.1 type I restriction endonuclease subunit S [Salinivibrio kushneri]
MSDWVRIPLDELVDVIDPHPSHRAPDAVVQGIPFIGIGDIREDGSLIEGKGRIVSDKIFDEHIQRYQISDRTIGFGRVATIGKVISFQNPTTKFVVSPTMAVLEPKPGTNRDFILHALRSEDIQEQLDKLLTGSTRSSLGIELLRKLTILHPATAVAKKISKVLNSVSSQIDATQALIDKYTAIKQGIMADLFSRGIDPETKALRPTFEEAPDLYHETPLGMLPKGWDAYDIADISDVIDPNPSHRNPIYRADGFAFISTVEFIEGDSVETNTSRRVAESVVLEQERRCAFNENSIVFSRKGTIGETRFVPTSCRFALLDSLCVLNPKNVDVTYFYHSLRSPSLKTQINQLVMGQALPQVSIGRVRELLIPMPNDAMEQRLIGQRIGGIAELLNSELLHLRKLQAQKSGLMQDLLTGKVPVPA